MNLMNERIERLLPKGVPRYVRCYDNGGKTIDRHTVVFTGRYRHKTGGTYWYLGMNATPTHPQGFGQSGELKDPIDRPRSSHLGKRIPFEVLPEPCQTLTLDMYRDLWDLNAE